MATLYKKTEKEGEKGNIAVIVAVSLTVLIGMLALVVDGGHLYATKDKYQNGVEAAALAGALHLCDGDYENIIRKIALENGLPSTAGGALTISRGFYDENDQYGDFTIYKNFIDESSDDFPDHEYNNAVTVSLEADVSTFLSGMFGKKKVRVKAASVAYLKRTAGMIALNDDSVIRIGPDTTLQNGDLYSNGDIKFQDKDYRYDAGWWPKEYPKPEFINANLHARGRVMECGASASAICLEVGWDSGVESSMSNAFSGSPRLTEIKPCDNDYIESLRETADVVYEIDDAATDAVFWGRNADSTNFAFDLTGERVNREVIFFDAEGKDVLISEGAYCLGCGGGGCVIYDPPTHQPNGDRIYNVTFITNGNIMMDYSGWSPPQIWGAEGDEQAVIITSGNLQMAGSSTLMEGIVYRCGGFFGTHPASDVGGVKKARIIADGDIRLHCCPYNDCAIGATSTRRWIGTTDFKFGPPCPFPGGVRLGALEPVGG